MAFTFNDGDGNIVKEVWSCTECIYCSTKNHFGSNEDGPVCPLCRAPAEKNRTIQKSTGMSDFKYRQIQDYLVEDVSGVGTGTVESLVEHFEDGDDFLNAARAAYDDRAWDRLACVSGVGESTAKNIALGMAESEGWSGGKAEQRFDL